MGVLVSRSGVTGRTHKWASRAGLRAMEDEVVASRGRNVIIEVTTHELRSTLVQGGDLVELLNRKADAQRLRSRALP